jgi:hypothetical protein
MSRTTDRSARRWNNRHNGTDGAVRRESAPKAPRAAAAPAAPGVKADLREGRRMAPYEMSYDVTHGYTLDRSISVT